MPFRQEGSLANWLRQRENRFNLDDAGHFIQQAASALQYAHNHAIISHPARSIRVFPTMSMPYC
jgi:serine/threonine protein kinase